MRAIWSKEGHVGAVAFSRTGDAATGDFSAAEVIRKLGDVPDVFEIALTPQKGPHMKIAFVLVTAVALTVTAVAAPGPVEAHDRFGPDISAGLVAGALVGGVYSNGYRCSEGPVYNFYHGAYFGGLPLAVYLGYAYRPYYRYTAYRVFPPTYACYGYQRHYSGWRRW
jgi:hypothetical protein